LLFDIRNANRASLPPIVNIVDLAKFRPHDLPTLQPLTTLPETCLELDHELAYSSIAEVETSPLDILRRNVNKDGTRMLSYDNDLPLPVLVPMKTSFPSAKALKLSLC
jgi:hypothetical protein